MWVARHQIQNVAVQYWSSKALSVLRKVCYPVDYARFGERLPQVQSNPRPLVIQFPFYMMTRGTKNVSESRVSVAGRSSNNVAEGRVSKDSKKQKKRERGQKFRIRKVLREDERPAEKNLGRGRVREFDIFPSDAGNDALPRKMRNLFSAKAALELKSTASSNPMYPCAPTKKKLQSDHRKEVLAKSDIGKSARQIVVEAVRKNSHQHEKKKAYYKKRDERKKMQREQRKMRRGRRSDDEDFMGDTDPKFSWNHPRFGEQAQAPPKLDKSFRRKRL